MHRPTTLPAALVVAWFLHLPAMGQGYLVNNLGPGIALDINGAGQVVGKSGEFGFFFDGGRWELLTELVTPNVANPSAPPARIPATASTLVGINDSGDRVGTIVTASSTQVVVLVSGTNMVALDMRPLSYDAPNVTGINNAGQVSGWQVSPPYGHNNGIQVGGTLGVANFSRLHAVNAAGVFAGSWGASSPAFRDFRAYPCRAVVVSPSGTTTVLDSRTLPDQYLSFADNSSDENHWSDAYGINSAGTVVGAIRSSMGGPRHAFRSDGTAGSALLDLGTLGGARSCAYDVNSAGQVVGEAETSGGVSHAFLWSDGRMTDLNALLAHPAGDGWELLVAKAINDRGQIVGQGRFQGSLRAFLLSPPGLGAAPWIRSAPAGARLALGQGLTLSVDAGGADPLAYQWIRNELALPNATNAAYQIPYATANDAGGYSVRVSNAGGSVLSAVVRVEVLDPELSVETFVGLRITGEVGATYEIQSRLTASMEAWQPLARVTLATTNQSWIDPDSNRHRSRLYRAVRQP